MSEIGPQTKTRTLFKQIKTLFVLFVGGLLGVFALQNMAQVELKFLLWSFESRRIVVIGFSLIAGLFIGWVWGRSGRQPSSS